MIRADQVVVGDHIMDGAYAVTAFRADTMLDGQPTLHFTLERTDADPSSYGRTAVMSFLPDSPVDVERRGGLPPLTDRA